MATPSNETQERPRGSRTTAILIVMAIGLVVAAIVTSVARVSGDRIRLNEQAWIREHLDALVPRDAHDNDMLADKIEVSAPDLFGTSTPAVVYRARKGGEPVAVVVRTIAPDGYRGPIELLVAINRDGVLLGVQVLRHNETPGLGDAFEKRDPRWLARFRGLSLSSPPQQRWTVRKDGGDFDAFTGATITPRAIVKAVRRTLEFQRSYADRLYEGAAK
jgi:electron transport complex protein RnfG